MLSAVHYDVRSYVGGALTVGMLLSEETNKQTNNQTYKRQTNKQTGTLTI